MPTKQITITVCANCGKEACDGGLWRWVEALDLSTGVITPLSDIPPKQQTGCTLEHGRYGAHDHKALTGKAIGDRVTIRFENRGFNGQVIVEKITD